MRFVSFAMALIVTCLSSTQVFAVEFDVIDLVARDAERASNLALERAPLKSASDVHDYNKAMPDHLSPFSALDDADRGRFIQSLKFNEKGLTEFDYTALKALSSEDVYKILALFGMQASTEVISDAPKTKAGTRQKLMASDFLLDHYCERRGTCMEDTRRACTSNC